MRLLILFLLLSSAAFGQTTYYIRADTTRLQKNGGNNELILENGTRTIKGILTNVGNGRTQFIQPRKSGDTLFVGRDTLTGFSGGGTTYTFTTPLSETGGVVSLLNTAVTPGSYTNTNLTVDAKGRITAASNGSSSGTPAGNYGNVQINRNSLFASPASDSLDFDAGLSIKGGLTVTSLPSGADTDSAMTWNATSKVVNRKPMTVIDISSRDSGDVVQWNGTKNVYVPMSGGSSVNPTGWLRGTVDSTTNFLVAGDSVLTNTGLVDKRIKVKVEGVEQDTVRGYIFNRSGGTVTFRPALTTGQFVMIEVYDTLSVYDIALEAPPVAPVALSLASARTHFANTGTTYHQAADGSQNNAGFDHYALDALNLPSGTSGAVYFKFVTGENDYMIGFKTANSNGDYTTLSAGIYINGSSALRTIDGGSPVGSFGTAVNNTFYRIYRNGATGACTYESSPDETWSAPTVLATLSFNSTATLYIGACVLGAASSIITNPKGINVL